MAERTVSVKLKADVAQYMASMRAAGRATSDLEKAGLDLKVALNNEEDAVGRVRVASARLEELRKSGKASVAQLAQAEEQLASAHRNVEVAQDRVIAATKRYEAAQKSASNTDRQRLGDFERETEKVAKRANAQFSALAFTALTVGLPVAAAVAGAGVAAGLAGVPLLFAGIAYKAVASSREVQTAWSNTVQNLQDKSKGWAQPFEQEFVDAAGKVDSTLETLSPQIGQAFSNSAKSVGILVDGVDEFALRAMPGLVTATANSEAPLRGLQVLLEEAGSGTTDFFTNLSRGAESSQGILVTTGGIVHDLLGFTGNLFANLSNNGGPALQGFRADLQQVEGVVESLTASTSPLYSGLEGFLSTVSGGLSIVSGFANVLHLLPPGMSEFGGSLFAVNKISGLFGTSLTATGFGLRAFSTQIDEAGNKTTPFKQALADTEAGGTKLSRGLSAIASSGFNPLGLALVSGGLLLDLWGKKSQEAAQRAADHRKAVDDLTSAFQKDNGAIGANVAAVASKALADKNAYANAHVFGASLDDVSRAGLGQADAMNTLVGQAKDYVTQLLSGNRANQQMLPTVLANVDAFAKQGGNASDLVNNLSAVRMHSLHLTDAQKSMLIQTLDGVAAIGEEGRATIDAAAKQAAMQAALDRTSQLLHDQMTPGMYAGQVATDALKNAFQGLNAVNGDVAAKGQAIIDVLDQLSGKPKSAEEALQSYNDTLRNLGTQFDKAASDGSRFTHSMIDAGGAINTTTEFGSNLQNVVQQAAQNMASYGQALKDAGVPADQINSKLGAMRDQLAGQLKQLGLTPAEIDKVLTHYNALPANIVTALGLEGAPQVQNELANIISQMQQVPAEKGVHVTALTSEAQSALMQMGYQIIRLPNGTFQVFANTAPGKQGANDLLKYVGTSRATITVDGNVAPANGKVTATVQRANGSVGTMTLDSRTDPATGKLMVAVQAANGARGFMTVDAFNAAAKNVIGDTVVVANNARGFVQVGANTAAAEAEIGRLVRTRTMNVQVNYVTGAGGVSTGARFGPRAVGGIDIPGAIPMASGGILKRIPHLATVVPPNMPRIIGDNMRVPEAFIPLDPRSARSRAILDAANKAMGTGAAGAIPNLRLQAAREMLAAVESGKNLFEDFSFRGNSALVRQFNGDIADAFYKANPGIDFGAPQSADAVRRFLRSYVQTNSVRSAVRTGGAVSQSGAARGAVSYILNFEGAFPNYVGDHNQLIKVIRTSVRDMGGDVQKALGQR